MTDGFGDGKQLSAHFDMHRLLILPPWGTAVEVIVLFEIRISFGVCSGGGDLSPLWRRFRLLWPPR